MRRQGPQEGWRAAGVLLSVDGVCAVFTGLVAAAHPEARWNDGGRAKEGDRGACARADIWARDSANMP